jgi:tRNA-dihydrouridine synthase
MISTATDEAKVQKLFPNEDLHGLKYKRICFSYDLLKNICNDVNIKVIGNNSVNSIENVKKMIDTGVYGFSIARSVISGNLDFNITNF